MEKKINVAELLKDCPQGMELDCTMWENVTFGYIQETSTYPIKVMVSGEVIGLTEYGCYTHDKQAKCVIFPEGKTTWEGFHRPFKDGDIITCTNRVGSFVAIFKEKASDTLFKSYVVTSLCKHPLFKINSNASDYSHPRFATKEEKEKLFNAIKANGYRWNAETKTLEKSVEPKFKVGNRITNGKASIKIGYIDDNYYYEIGRNIASRILIKEQEEWRLDKFDINTLVPLEDKVLVRESKTGVWEPSFYGFFNQKKQAFLYHKYYLANVHTLQ